MKSSLYKLQKFLKLEAERNYDNRAVVGGLERILESWQAEARAEGLTEKFVQAVSARLRDYSKLTPASRSEALGGLWGRIGQESGETLPPLPPYREGGTEKTTPQVKESSVSSPKPAAASQPHHRAVPAPQVHMPPQPSSPSVALDAPITVLPGVGPRHGQTLANLKLFTLGDMLYFFPRRYDDYTQLKTINRLWYGEEVSVIAVVDSAVTRTIRSGRLQITEAVVSDGSGALRITWFNQPWIAKRLHAGMQIVISGKIDQYLGRLVMNNPEWEPLEQENLHTNKIVPVYPLTANITQRWLRRLMHQVITYWAPRLQDPLLDQIRQAAGVLDLGSAIQQAHFPDSLEQLKAARHRLAFDEIFLLQLGVLRQKHNWQERTARIYEVSDEWLENQTARLPYTLTGAQQRTLQDVRRDLVIGRPMNRLLQGDVGSGKTVIAGLSVAILALHGAQSALMAPTSILAEQHYQSMLSLLAGEGGPLTPDQIRLMVGATVESEKRQIREGLSTGEIKLIIGTHALIEEPVQFSNLQLAIIDEQHRFGVEQRALLRAKGENPHLLVMTATPIPRSLALTVYGDLDLSVIDEMPPGRQAVVTQVFFPRERERAYSLIRHQAEQGKQAFMIYPLVEENENSETLAAVEEHVRLQREVFPKLRLGLLHGRMKGEEKDAVMADFRDGNTHILVSTSVVEVGVDVPNATVMVIEGANRFGLSQLHQFRGRVGRGQDQAYCILIPEVADEIENERLSAMAETNDGFLLAERDLEQRGPGEFLGTRQSGYSKLRMASLSDVRLIENARRQAQTLFEVDPELNKPEHKPLAAAVQSFWGDGQGDIS